MKIYTKTGDKGKTSLIGGKRVSKADLRIESYGNVDELNAWIGLLRDISISENRRELLKQIQNTLFNIGSWLASDPQKQLEGLPKIEENDIELLENVMDEMDSLLSEMRFFVLPGGHLYVSYAHIARTVCRRAERGVIRLAAIEKVEDLLVKYLNRLSDFLFILSRSIAHEGKVEEIKWIPKK